MSSNYWNTPICFSQYIKKHCDEGASALIMTSEKSNEKLSNLDYAE